MPNIEIKSYIDSYKNQIIQLIVKIQTNEFGLPVTMADQPDLEQIPEFYQQGSGNFWVATADDRVVGTVALVDIGNDQVVLKKMFVDKDYRGKEVGVAKALLDEAILWCKNAKIREIYLGTTSVFLAAHRFYEKNGFTEISKSALPKTFPMMKIHTKFYMYCC